MEIIINKNSNLVLSFVPKILAIEEKITEFDSEDIFDNINNHKYPRKLISTEVEIRIKESIWIIPFQFIFEAHWDRGNKEYTFNRMRIINIPLFKIANQKYIEHLFFLLIMLDSNPSGIDHNAFNKISASDLFFDLFNYTNFVDQKFEIRCYPNIAKNENDYFNIESKSLNSNHYSRGTYPYIWKIPHISINGLNFIYEKVLPNNFEKLNNNCSINILPQFYHSSYQPFINSYQEYIKRSILNSPKSNTLYNQFHYTSSYYILYLGSLQNCLKNFRSQSLDVLFKKLQNEIGKTYRESEFQEQRRYWNKGWREDYYNVMTDGQMGDFNDFKGNIDDLDTWNRG